MEFLFTKTTSKNNNYLAQLYEQHINNTSTTHQQQINNTYAKSFESSFHAVCPYYLSLKDKCIDFQSTHLKSSDINVLTFKVHTLSPLAMS